MNKQRRKELNAVLDDLEKLKLTTSKDEALKILKDSQVAVDDCATYEEIAHDSMPESFQWTSRVEDMGDNVAELNDANSILEELISTYEEEKDTFVYDDIKDDITEIINNLINTINR